VTLHGAKDGSGPDTMIYRLSVNTARRNEVMAYQAGLGNALRAAVQIRKKRADGDEPPWQYLLHCRPGTFRQDVMRYTLWNKKQLTFRAIAHYESAAEDGVRHTVPGIYDLSRCKPHGRERSVSDSIKRVSHAVNMMPMAPQWSVNHPLRTGRSISYCPCCGHEGVKPKSLCPNCGIGIPCH